jgi:ankyrin repeat protein
MMDFQGNFGNTALHTAAQCGRIEMTTYLLGKGFDVNKKNELSETPLHLAASGYYSGE